MRFLLCTNKCLNTPINHIFLNPNTWLKLWVEKQSSLTFSISHWSAVYMLPHLPESVHLSQFHCSSSQVICPSTRTSPPHPPLLPPPRVLLRVRQNTRQAPSFLSSHQRPRRQPRDVLPAALECLPHSCLYFWGSIIKKTVLNNITNLCSHTLWLLCALSTSKGWIKLSTTPWRNNWN